MHRSQFLGLSAVAALILALAGLVVSIQVSNPLLAGGDSLQPAAATLGIVALAVGGAILAATRGLHGRTPYW